MFTVTQKTLLYIIIVIFAENASFRSYGVICLLRMGRGLYILRMIRERRVILIFNVSLRNL